eukprot:g31610.t1
MFVALVEEVRVAAPPRPTPTEAPSCSPRLSVVITTSPVPSHPSTMMIEAVIASFQRVKGLAECPLIIVCDGFKVVKKTTWKAGKVTEEKAANYEEFKCNLKKLQDAGQLPAGSKLIILQGHNGQAMAVKAALQEVDTPLVCIHQHDLEFTVDFCLEKVLDVLEDEATPVKYVGLPLLVNLHYEAIAFQHHGVKVKVEEYQGLSFMPMLAELMDLVLDDVEIKGYPPDPPVEFYPSRTMTNRKQRKVRHILDIVLELADAAWSG